MNQREIEEQAERRQEVLAEIEEVIFSGQELSGEKLGLLLLQALEFKLEEKYARGLIKLGADVNVVRKAHITQHTALPLAAQNGLIVVVNDLLAKGAKVDMKGDVFEQTAIMDAAENGHLEIVRILLDHGANVHA